MNALYQQHCDETCLSLRLSLRVWGDLLSKCNKLEDFTLKGDFDNILTDKMIKSFPTSLHKLSIENPNLCELPLNTLLTHLTQLELLDLTKTKIKRIDLQEKLPSTFTGSISFLEKKANPS